MLQTIRDNSQGVVAKIIIGFIIGIFALFGAESIVGGFLGSNNVVSVNGEDITEQELAVSIQNLMASMGANVADFDEELIREVALNQLIEDKLLMQAAQESGMAISDDSVDRQILRTPQFQIGGVFDNEMARRTMAAQGYTPQAYRQLLAESMMMGQLANAYAATSFVTDADLQRIAELQTQTRDFRYLSIPLGNRTLGQAVEPEAIEAYYEQNPEQFTSPEQVSVAYVMLDKDAIFDEVEVDEATVMERYEADRDAAVADVERRAAHILFDLGSGSEEDVIARANEVKARIDAGEDFGELAREFSVDEASAAEDGDIGFTDGSVFPQEMESALAALEVGEVSDPVVSEFGVHLLKLTEYDAQDYPPFEEVEERLRRELSQARVDELYFSRLESMANLAFENFDLQAINEELGLEIQQSAFFGREGGSSAVTSDPAVIEAAFSPEVLEEDLNSDLIELGETRAVVIHLAEHRPSALQPLEDVRADIAVELRTQMEQEQARAVGEQILAALQAGESIDSFVQQESLEWSEREGVRRGQFDINTEIVANVFSMPAPAENDSELAGFQLNNGAYVVIELQSVNAGSLDELGEDQRQQLAAAMLENRGRSVFSALLSNLQEEASIR
ncbi:SurA N-terminal domain-containing protein [Pseudohongiella sp. SYSU M77423]|uniref:SurA N-terminal domain-containing protein n=1 Tax=Pseudohongiella sp. SYSU M77423 TaxID=3042312 RepID=UPI002480F472|nr:SurA N-terminal domain-containing protein [Pseudohongiella sp. SYSU M77423]MDH7943216.1 SurA N-terminal domain-containing protein [Pseudohongiella sp. SYSU M77423]